MENTELMIAPCAVMLLVPKDEDPWEYNIVPRKGLVTHSVRGVHASLQELSNLRMILKNDGVPWRELSKKKGQQTTRISKHS